jgi:hypothetical protein
VDDPVPASSRPWVDAENFHAERLGIRPDVPPDQRLRIASIAYPPSSIAGARAAGHLPRRDVPAERVGEPDDHAEERADRRRVAQRLVGDTGRARSSVFGAVELVRAQRQLLEKRERRLQLGRERRRAPVVDDRLPDLIAERVRRNCAVGASSEGHWLSRT